MCGHMHKEDGTCDCGCAGAPQETPAQAEPAMEAPAAPEMEAPQA